METLSKTTGGRRPAPSVCFSSIYLQLWSLSPTLEPEVRKGRREGGAWFFTFIIHLYQVVVWDYHVILVYTGDDSTLIYDLDSTLPFPASFGDYCQATFGSDAQLQDCYHRKLRVIPAQKYLDTFASDRRHMKSRLPDGKEGEWLQPPPIWPCIRTDAAVHNLDSFIDMTDGAGEGEVLDLDSFVSKLSRHRRENL